MTALLLFLAIGPLLIVPGLPVDQFERPKAVYLLLTAYALAVGFWIAPPPLDFATLAALSWPVACLAAAVRADRPQVALFGYPRSCDGALHQVAYVVLFLAARSMAVEDVAIVVSTAAAGVAGYTLLQACGVPILETTAARVGDYIRPPSTLGHANHVGAYLAAAAPFMLTLEGWPVYAFIPLAAAVAVTVSRAAWVALAAGACAFSLLARPPLWGLGVLGMATATLFVVPVSRARLRTLLALGSEERVSAYRVAWRAFRRRPWLGWGLDHAAPAMARFARPGELAGWYLRVHSEPLHIALTTGIVGVAAATAWAAAVGVAALERPEAAPIASLVAFAVANAVGFHVVATAALAAVCAGLLVGP